MKVLLVSDFGIHHNAGGAQRSNEILMQYGRSLGHTVVEYNFDSSIDLLMDSYDVVISSNLEWLVSRNPHLINFLGELPRHCRLEHDMNRYLTPDQRKKLFGNCFKSFFLTDFHYELFKTNYGDIFPNPAIVADPIDTKMFFNENRQRSDGIVYVGFFHEFKGTYNFFDYVTAHPEQKFIVAGWGEPKFVNWLQDHRSQVTYLKELSFQMMPNLYNAYRTIYYCPNVEEPFCRSVGEALLCGMDGIFNDKIGAVHHMKKLGPEAFKASCQNAPQEFWNHICQA